MFRSRIGRSKRTRFPPNFHRIGNAFGSGILVQRAYSLDLKLIMKRKVLDLVKLSLEDLDCPPDGHGIDGSVSSEGLEPYQF